MGLTAPAETEGRYNKQGRPSRSTTATLRDLNMAKSPRRRTPNFDDKYSLIASRIPKNRPAVLAYRCAVVGLVPVIGLLMGIFAIVLGFLGRRRFYADPEQRGLGHAVAAIVLGVLELLTNGVGLALIWIGMQSLGD